MDVRTASNAYPRQKAWIFHVGDTWNATSKLTLNYGLRWDYYSPSTEKYDRLAFFDPNGVNPSAGGRLGSLAYAGNSWGEASYGARYPEEDFYGGFAPRLGVTYALNTKTLIRAGWGIFYDRAFYPGWGAGMAQDGFNSNVSFGSSLAGVAARPSTSRTASPRTTPRRRSSPRTSATARASRTGPSTATSGRARSSGT